MRDVIHPVTKRIQVNPANRYAVRRNIHQPPKESFVRRLQVNDHNGIQFHLFDSWLLKKPSVRADPPGSASAPSTPVRVQWLHRVATLAIQDLGPLHQLRTAQSQ